MSDKPKPKRTKVRFHTKEQIIARIDKFTAKRDAEHRRAAQLLEDAKNLYRQAADPKCTFAASLTAEAKSKQNRADKLGKAVKRLEEKVLPPLKRKLAEFQTEVIPGFLPDNSVEEP